MISSFTAASCACSRESCRPSRASISRLHQRRRAGEEDGEALLAGGKSERERHMRLAGAAVAERDDVLVADDILRTGQLQRPASC